jgi:flavin-dependent dehydrogenase
MNQHEVVIIGGGPGGSVLGSYLAKAGVDVAIVEREAFPRFHIGESLLPFSMDIFREIGVLPQLDSGKYIRKFGAQFVNHEEEGEIYFDFASGLDGEHPMAYEVPRADFDNDLLEHAQKLGAKLYGSETVKAVDLTGEGVSLTTDRQTLRARYLVDASGRDAFFGKQTKIRFPNLDLNNIGVFTHFEGVERLEGNRVGDISIAMLKNHRWSWMIPFQGTRTSVGVVCASKEVRETEDRERFLLESIASCSAFASRMEHARRVADIGMISNYSHYCETLVGDKFILVGDAASFLDPIFSSGVHLAVSMAREAAKVIVDALAQQAPLAADGRQANYERFVRVGTKRFHSFIRMFYDTNFVRDMKKTHELKHIRQAFTSVVAGDVWNEANPLFRTGVLG